MQKILNKAMRAAAVLLGLTLAMAQAPQAAIVTTKVDVKGGWKSAGIQVKAGDTVVVKARKILRLADGMSVNSNGEWLLCWSVGWHAKGKQVLQMPGRPLAGAPAGALIFRVGEGTPFFVPRAGGNPGKDYTADLATPGWEKLVNNSAEAKKWSDEEMRRRGWEKLPGYASEVVHQFVAQESGPLFLNVNLSEAAKREYWNWVDYQVSIIGKKSTECQITGRVVDQAGQPVQEAEVQVGPEKKITPADGSFNFLVSRDGKYPVNASKEGYLPVQKQADVLLERSDFIDLGVIMLRDKPGTVSGKVLTPDGKPAAGAIVTVGAMRVGTRPDGSFIASANKGVYTVKAEKNQSNGMPASGEKEGVAVLPGRDTQAGAIVIAPAISAVSAWTATTRYIQKGQILTLKTGGEINRAGQKFGPAGLPGKPGGPASLLAAANYGSLVARIGAGKPFLVGPGGRFTAQDNGVLYFGVNLPLADRKGLSGVFTFGEMEVLSLGELEGYIVGSNNKPLTMAAVKITGIEDTLYTDANGRFFLPELPANKVYNITITFPGYNLMTRSVVVQLGRRTAMGRVMLSPAPVTGVINIKLLPKTGTTGGLVPVFVEVTNTSARNGLWGGFLASLKARSLQTGKEYPGMSPTYMVLSPGERKGAELICHLPVSAPPGDYLITAELRAPETVSIQDAAKQFEARKELEDKLKAVTEIKGRAAAQATGRINVIRGVSESKLDPAARLMLPTITPKVFSPAKGQLVTGKIALREKSVMLLGKEVEVFKDQNGEPLLIWNSYEGLYLSSREDGARKDDWFWIGQSNVQADDFTVYWDSSKFQDGDYLIKATMKTNYGGKPIEGSMNVMIKVRNDPRPGMIRGKVTNEDGRPLGGVTVRRLARGQNLSGLDWDSLETKSEVAWDVEDVAVSNYNGDYVFTNVLSGDNKLQFSLDKYMTASRDVVLKPGQALAAPAVALEGEKCRVTGAIRLDDGTGAAGAQVSAAGPSPLAIAAGENGQFVLDGLRSGVYRVTASRGGYDPAVADFACAPGEVKAIPGLLLRRIVFTVAGSVRDEGGKPLSGVTVIMDKSGAGAATGQDGRFALPNVPGGSHALAFTRTGYEQGDLQFEAVLSSAPGASRTVQADMIMKPAKAKLAGKVIPAAAQLFIDGAEVQLEQGGRYEAVLPPGEHALQASKKAFETFEQKVTLQPGENLALDIKLVPARGDFKLTVLPADALASVDGVSLATAEGAAKVKLAPGKHALLVQKPGYRSEEKEIEINSEAETALEVSLAALPGSIEGSVDPAAAKLEIDGVKVDADKGAFRLEVAPGKHTVAASHGNLEPYQAEVEVAAGEVKTLAIKLAPKALKAEAALAASAAEALPGQELTLNVQAPEANAGVELYSEKGLFGESGKNSLTGRADAEGRFSAKWSSQDPAKHRIRVRIVRASGAAEERETEVEVKFAAADLDAVIKNVRGSVNMGELVNIEAQVRNTGLVSGKYRLELELRGKTDLPFFTLKPLEIELAAGESKPAKFDWRVGALGDYTAKLTAYLVKDNGQLQRIAVYQGQLSFSWLGELTGKIQVAGGKIKFSPEVRGMKMEYQVANPGNLGLEQLDGQDVKGQCKVIKQVGYKGELMFMGRPQPAK